MIDPKEKRFVEEEGSMMMKSFQIGDLRMTKNVKKANITKTYHTANGALIKGSKVRIESANDDNKKVRVSDEVGRLFWVELKDVKMD